MYVSQIVIFLLKELQRFLERFNKLKQDIKFKMKIGSKEIQFFIQTVNTVHKKKLKRTREQYYTECGWLGKGIAKAGKVVQWLGAFPWTAVYMPFLVYSIVWLAENRAFVVEEFTENGRSVLAMQHAFCVAWPLIACQFAWPLILVSASIFTSLRITQQSSCSIGHWRPDLASRSGQSTLCK